MLALVAESLGVPVAGLRFLTALFLIVPWALLWRYLPRGLPTHSPWTIEGGMLRHVASVAAALSVGAWCFGVDSLAHPVVCIAVTWLAMWVGRSHRGAVVAFSWVFNLGYLCVAYIVLQSSEDYDIDWTLPHCVLTLRLIGLTWDYYDGDVSQLTPNQMADRRLNAVVAQPTLIEVLGFAYFFPAYLAGPQFTLRSYRAFVAGDGYDYVNGKEVAAPPSPWMPAVTAITLGIAYIALSNVGKVAVPIEWVLTPDFTALPLWKRILYAGIAGKCALGQYIGCWKIVEGATCITGAGYYRVMEGKTGQVEERWDGLSNVNLAIWESEPVSSKCFGFGFNLRTNDWVKRYVMKRLIFLGSKRVSQFASLIFLAVWHGFSFAYYLTFFVEFITIIAETMTLDRLRPYVVPVWNRYPFLWTYMALPCGNIIKTILIGELAVIFGLLSYRKVSIFMNALCWFPVVAPVTVLALHAALSFIPSAANKSKPKHA